MYILYIVSLEVYLQNSASEMQCMAGCNDSPGFIATIKLIISYNSPQ